MVLEEQTLWGYMIYPGRALMDIGIDVTHKHQR